MDDERFPADFVNKLLDSDNRIIACWRSSLSKSTPTGRMAGFLLAIVANDLKLLTKKAIFQYQ